MIFRITELYVGLSWRWIYLRFSFNFGYIMRICDAHSKKEGVYAGSPISIIIVPGGLGGRPESTRGCNGEPYETGSLLIFPYIS